MRFGPTLGTLREKKSVSAIKRAVADGEADGCVLASTVVAPGAGSTPRPILPMVAKLMASGVLAVIIGTLSEDRYAFTMPVCMRQITVNQVHVVPDSPPSPTCLLS
jgi:hypothetical protein